MTLADALSALDGRSLLDAADALQVRRIVYADDCSISQAEADALFKLNADAGQISPEWKDLFVEAMIDFVVRQEDPAGYVDDAKADWLIAAVSRNSRVRTDEVEMLIHVLETADQVPERLSVFVLGLLETLIVKGLGQGGALTRENIDRLRRVIFAVGGDGAIAVSRREAEALLDINDALKGAAVDPAWTDLFARAVGNAVMYESPWHADAGLEQREEAWLADTSIHPFGRMKTAMTTAASSGAFAEGVREVLHWDFANHDLEAPEAADEAMQARAEAVTGEEAHWLVQRLNRDGRIDANEQALLAFIRANARSVDPSLQTLSAGEAA